MPAAFPRSEKRRCISGFWGLIEFRLFGVLGFRGFLGGLGLLGFRSGRTAMLGCPI